MITPVTRRELDELVDHLSSHPSIWKEVDGDVWARYEGEHVVLVMETYFGGPGIETVWPRTPEMDQYASWLLEHFTTRGVRLRLESLLPNIGPNMIDSIVALLDGWTADPGEVDLARSENEAQEMKRAHNQHAVPSVGAKPRVLSPYVRRLLGISK